MHTVGFCVLVVRYSITAGAWSRCDWSFGRRERRNARKAAEAKKQKSEVAKHRSEGLVRTKRRGAGY